jgi:2-polyprenyl-6-methoxyphenol hydroxylase-like FAD-dependent oxidoreductase
MESDCAFVARPHTAAGTTKAATDGIELARAVSNTNGTAGALREWEEERLDAGRQLVAAGYRLYGVISPKSQVRTDRDAR